jgi:hypothetical protein
VKETMFSSSYHGSKASVFKTEGGLCVNYTDKNSPGRASPEKLGQKM